MLMALDYTLEFYNPPYEKPYLIFCDNKAVCQLTQSDHSSRRMLHVARRLLYLKERYSNGDIITTFVRTTGNLADLGTKLLGSARFHELCSILYARESTS